MRPDEETATRKATEQLLARRFVKAAERRIEQLSQMGVDDEKKSNTSYNFQLETEEQKALLAMNGSGLLQGTLAGLVSFVVLRRIRAGFLRHLQRQQQPPPSSSTSSSSTTISMSSSHSAPTKSPFQQHTSLPQPRLQQSANPFHPKGDIPPAPPTPTAATTTQRSSRTAVGPGGAFYNVVAWMVDATLSFYVAAYVSLRDTKTLATQFADLPLIEGRSAIATEFCPEFLAEWKRMQLETQTGNVDNETETETNERMTGSESTQEDNEMMKNEFAVTDQREALQNPSSLFLQAFLRFCNNCQQRMAYEKLLRQQQGLRSDEPVAIPPPGVPVRHSILNASEIHDDSDDIDNTSSDARSNSPSYDFSSEKPDSVGAEEDWADSFVTDEEEQAPQDRRNRRSGKN